VVPTSTAFKTPLLVPIVATAVLLLLHAPPVVALLSVADAPAHTLVAPVMDGGEGLTVNAVVVMQPVASV